MRVFRLAACLSATFCCITTPTVAAVQTADPPTFYDLDEDRLDACRSARPIGTLTALAAALFALSACGPKTESTTSANALALLRSGNAQICVAPEVEETLRRLIRPKNIDTSSYSIDFATTSLQTFDGGVSKATCQTSVSITGASGSVVDAQALAYDITPDARDPQSFIISTSVAFLTARLETDATDEQSVRDAQNALSADQSRLAALVKPGWLIGRWVEQSQGSDACFDGPYLDFARGNKLSGPTEAGHWRLTGQTLQMTVNRRPKRTPYRRPKGTPPSSGVTDMMEAPFALLAA